MSTHACPNCRKPGIDDSRFACPRCWALLPADVQRVIYRTARLGVLHPERRAAFRAAEAAWSTT